MTHSSPTPTSQGRRRAAMAVAVGLPLLTLAATAEMMGLPVYGDPGPGEHRAAIAIRDHVHPIEKLGTWSFVLPRLEDAYAEVRHFTQGKRTGWVNDDQREECTEALTELLRRYDHVDLFLLAHTNSYHRWAEDVPEELRQRIRLVYNSGCWCAKDAQQWLDVGATSYVAHPSAASHIAFFVPFLRRWTAGRPLDDAVVDSNEFADSLYGRLAVLGGGFAHEYRAWSKSHARIWGEEELSIGSAP